MLSPLYQFWGYFKADIHHNVAIYFSKERSGSRRRKLPDRQQAQPIS